MLSRCRKQRKAATSVELAFVLPIIFLLFFSFWEWSRVEMIRQACATATFEAARRGTIPSGTVSEMDTIAQNIMDVYFIDGVTINSTVDTVANVSTASVSVPLDQNLWSGAYLFSGKTLSADYSLNLEVSPD